MPSLDFGEGVLRNVSEGPRSESSRCCCPRVSLFLAPRPSSRWPTRLSGPRSRPPPPRPMDGGRTTGKLFSGRVMRARGSGTAPDAAWAASTVGLPIPPRSTPSNTPGGDSKA